MADIKTSVLSVGGEPAMVMLDYMISIGDNEASEFRLSYYPHKLSVFKEMLSSIFGDKAKHTIFGDFKELHAIEHPGFYIHVMNKPL